MSGGAARERARIADAYDRRAAGDLYSLFRPAHLRMLQEVEREALGLLAARGWQGLDGRRVLDVGCGDGYWLRRLLDWGVSPDQAAGIELLPGRAARARTLLPAACGVVRGDATALPWPDASFDLVCQFVVMSSILDPRVQETVARQMWRVRRPGGLVLWYDFRVDNPRNPDVTGVPYGRVRELFPAGHCRRRRVTLAPPLARRLAAVHPALCGLAGAVPPLRTHDLVLIGD